MPKAPEKNNKEKSSKAMYAGIFVAGLIVGVLTGWGFSGRPAGETASTATTTVKTTQSSNAQEQDTAIAASNSLVTETPGAGTVIVNSPQGAGSSVVVSKVNVTKPTWVAVYDNNGGVPGNALGATLFLPTASGGQTSGTIDLLRPIVSGKTYLVGQRLDNSDYSFSRANDAAVVDQSGNQVLMTLTVN